MSEVHVESPESQRALIVDDEALVRAIVRDALEADGWTVSEAPDGRAGLDFLRSEAIELLVVDLHMPHVDGLTLLRCLRDEPRWRGLPVVVVSASLDDPRVRLQLLRLGAALVEKPFSVRDLRRGVAAAVHDVAG